MYKYTIGNKEYKSKFNNDVSLFSINPPCLKMLSDDHYFSYNGFNPDYKDTFIFELASNYIKINVSKIDGRLNQFKSLKYVSIVNLFEVLKDNESFKSDMLKALKGELE